MKKCKYEGCEKEVVNFPNSTIKRKFCIDHAINGALYKVRHDAVIKARAEKMQKKADIMSADEYRATFVQPIINAIARMIDNEQPCIATGLVGKMSAGHFFSVGSNRTTCLNLHNIHAQSFYSNSILSGDLVRYRQGIIKTYGIEYMERIEALKQLKPIKLTKGELIEIKKIASQIRSELNKLPNKVYTPEERIEMREQFNKRIGIYE